MDLCISDRVKSKQIDSNSARLTRTVYAGYQENKAQVAKG